ncbi:MAG: sulfotransferase family protein [Acidimicrobiales bacterium]
MTLRIVGAGVGRTGTHSLKLALEQLLGGPCYHMLELFPRIEHVGLWHQAIRGEGADWDTLLAGFVAAVDWPAAAVWSDLAAANPDAIVLLSVRDSPEAWWASFSQTILPVIERWPTPGFEGWQAMAVDMIARLTPDYSDPAKTMAAYEAHNQAVRGAVAPSRLVEWRPGNGWGPICAALGVPIPADPFPHVNTTDEFRAMTGLVEGG